MLSPEAGTELFDELAGKSAGAVPPATASLVSQATTPRASLLGMDLTILGENVVIISQSTVQIDGHLKGSVHGKQVLINKGGSVTGEIWAERIDVRGEVHGSMIAVTLAIHESATVEGDVMHQKLSIAEGAEFDGRAHLIRDPSELMPILDADALGRGRQWLGASAAWLKAS